MQVRRGIAKLVVVTISLIFMAVVAPPGRAATPEEQALAILKRPPFAPTDVNLISPVIYPEATPMQPALPYAFSEQSVRAKLQAFLAKRFARSPDRLAAAMAFFDSPGVYDIVPDPRRRAAFALLTGSIAEGALKALQSGIYAQAYFGDPPAGAVLAQVIQITSSTSDVIFNRKYEFEDPRILAGIAAHEMLHEDVLVSNYEELIANAFDTLTFMQLVLETPSLPTTGTELTRQVNTKLIWLLNSRDDSGRIRLFSERGQVFPGSTTSGSKCFGCGFVEIGLGYPTPGNDYLTNIMRRVTRTSIASAAFDDATLDLLDQNINVFSAVEWVKVAKALKLDLNSEAPPAPALAAQGSTARMVALDAQGPVYPGELPAAALWMVPAPLPR